METTTRAVDAENCTAVQEFYRDCSVLVTGATGFMGKVLIERLLRCCPSLRQVFILIRDKKGVDVHSRAEEIFNDSLFARLKQEVPKFRHKVTVVPGDCSRPGLDISDADRQRLAREVDVVFHGAATVRFDEPLPVAMDINVFGTQHMLQLAKEMTRLKAFIHVSTAYAHCTSQKIEEQLYPLPKDTKEILSEIQALDRKELELVTPKFLGEYPNTYVYTKAFAENIVKEYAGDLPIGIFRPAVVIGTSKEPHPGWIDNIYGPTGVLLGVAIGLLRVVNINPKTIANMVPVDMTVGALIASAWEVHNSNKEIHGVHRIPIYNYVSSKRQPILWEEFSGLAYTHGTKFPSTKSIWYPTITLTRHYYVYVVLAFLLHTLPALCIDAVTLLCFKRPKMLKVYQKIHRFVDVISYFGTRNWDFDDRNVESLWQSLSPADQALWDFQITNLEWDDYICKYMEGCRINILKEDPSTMPAGRIKLRRQYWLHTGIKTALILVALKVNWLLFSPFFPSI